MYVYMRTQPRVWTVGHYTGCGEFIPEGDYHDPEDAADRVHWLNGRSDPPQKVLMIARVPDHERRNFMRDFSGENEHARCRRILWMWIGILVPATILATSIVCSM